MKTVNEIKKETVVNIVEFIKNSEKGVIIPKDTLYVKFAVKERNYEDILVNSNAKELAEFIFKNKNVPKIEIFNVLDKKIMEIRNGHIVACSDIYFHAKILSNYYDMSFDSCSGLLAQ